MDMEEMMKAAQEAAANIQKQMLEDLVTAAFNDARTKADQAANAEMQKVQQGMGLPPGFNFPGMG